MSKILRLLFILVVASVVFIFLNLNPLIKRSVETVGPMVLDVPVTLEKSDLSLLGSGELTQLTIGNPEGFKSKHLFNLGAVKLSVDILSLTGDTIHIKEVIVDSAHMIYEGNFTKSNISTLLKNLEGEPATDETPVPDTKEEKPAETENKTEKKLIIDHLLIKGTKVGYSNALLGGKTINLTLPTLEKRDIGKKEEGQSAQEIIKGLIKEINKSVVESIKKGTSQIGDELKDLGKDIKKENVKEELNKAKDKLKGLFGK